MYKNDIGIILFRNYGSWPKLETKNLLPEVMFHKIACAKFQNILLP